MQDRQDTIRHLSLCGGQAYAVAIDARDLVEQARRIHTLSPTNTAALGRTMMGALLCASDIKFDRGDATVTIDGGGPAGKVIAIATPHGAVRGYVQCPQADRPVRQTDHKLDVSGALGHQGSLTVIKDNGGEPYIGRVALQSGEVAEDLAYYFALSEQRPCLVFLGVLVDVDGTVKSAGGLGVFPLPGCAEETIAELEHIIPLAAELSHMLGEGTPMDDCVALILAGLDARQTQCIPARYQCTCSRERMERALLSMGEADLREIIEQDGQAELTCQFCHARHHFTREQLTELLEKAKA